MILLAMHSFLRLPLGDSVIFQMDYGTSPQRITFPGGSVAVPGLMFSAEQLGERPSGRSVKRELEGMAGFFHRCPVSSLDSAYAALLSGCRSCSYGCVAWHVCGGQNRVRKPRETSLNELGDSKEKNRL